MFIKSTRYLGLGFIVAFLLIACGKPTPISSNPEQEQSQEKIIFNVSGIQEDVATLSKRGGFSLVKVSGHVRHFGWDIRTNPPTPIPYMQPSANVHIWIAEYPLTRLLALQSDEDGNWEFWILKQKNKEVSFSIAYEKNYYGVEIEQAVLGVPLPEPWNSVQAKSQIFTVQDSDLEQVGMQLPDELYLFAAKMDLENQLLGLTGQHVNVNNLLVATVGKSWASLFNPLTPHGDPNATVHISPVQSALNGPIYFNNRVAPDPTLQATSYDGGVLFHSLPNGMIHLSAQKENVEYAELDFEIQSDFNLYVASPPHSLIGNNTSGPKEN